MSNGTTDGDEVALLVKAGEPVAEHEHLEESTEAPASPPQFGEDLPDDEIRKIASHLTRPLEPADLKPATSSDPSRLAQLIAATLASRKLSSSGAATILDQLPGTDGQPKAQIRLRPGTTRRKIAGSGVTPEPLVFQSEQSEALLANWADRTLGTNIQTNSNGHPASIGPSEPGATIIKPLKAPLSRATVMTIAIIATLAVATLGAFFLYPHFAPMISAR